MPKHRHQANLQVTIRHPTTTQPITLVGYEARAICELFLKPKFGCSTRFIAGVHVRSLSEKLDVQIDLVQDSDQKKQRYILRTPVELFMSGQR